MNIADTLRNFDAFKCIKFYNKNHVYKINNEISSLSVTRFLNLFLPYFDRDAIAKSTAKKNNVDLQTVLNEWEYEKDVACLKGTIFHTYIDNYLNNKILPLNKDEIQLFFKNNEQLTEEFYLKIAKLIMQFESFYEYYSDNFIHFKSEFVVGDVDDTRICGTIDNLSICRKTGEMYIIDYKTNKKFTEKNSYNKYLTFPINHLEDTKLNVYGLQLYMYKYIIEKYTTFRPKCLITWFNEKNNTYKLFTPPDLSKEITAMVNYYKSSNDTFTTKVSATEEYIMSLAD